MQPFRFHSIYQPRIWGGQSMRTMLGRELPDRETAYGEAWEISAGPEAKIFPFRCIPRNARRQPGREK